MSPQLFAAETYEVVVGDMVLELGPVPPNEAERLGNAFAAIDPWATYAYPASALASYLAGDEADGTRFLVRADGDVAGAVGLQANWLRGPYIRFLGILPGFQGRGIGSGLLTWIEAQTRAANARNLWVVASQINVGAIRFYERHGFAQAAEFDGLAYDDRVEILMRKRLVAAGQA